MYPRAASSTSTVRKVIALVRVCDVHVVGSRELVIDEVTLRNEVSGIWITFLVIVDCPPIEHHHRAFRYEVTLVPVVLGDGVIHAKFVDRSPSQ
jgi:hypothetical protein